ncbi:MAG: Carbohydrate kinase, partial [Planctomycetota bacterium]
MKRRSPIARPPRLPHDAHKGLAGRVLVLAGSADMPGAALLCAQAAQRAGAGLVRVACDSDEVRRALAVVAPEAVQLDTR